MRRPDGEEEGEEKMWMDARTEEAFELGMNSARRRAAAITVQTKFRTGRDDEEEGNSSRKKRKRDV